MAARLICYTLLCITFSFTLSADPLVTLKHGGQLMGKRFSYNGTVDVDLFLGKFEVNFYIYIFTIAQSQLFLSIFFVFK